MVAIKQFDIYVVDFDPSKGSEIKKTRPAVVISPSALNNNLNTVLIAPLTNTRKSYPSRVSCNFNNGTGEIVLDQIRGVDKKRLRRKLGTLDAKTSANIKKVLATMFS